MSQRVIAVCLVLFVLVTLWFLNAMYSQVNEARKDVVAASALAVDAATIAERARRESDVAQSAVPAIANRVTHLEQQTVVLRDALLAMPAINVRAMRPLKDAIDALAFAVAEVRAEAKGATTAARAANAKASAAHSVASEARDVATIAYNAEAGNTCVKLLGELEGQQHNLATLRKDMARIRDLGRDRRPLSPDYDDLFLQSLKLEFAMLQNVAAYNEIAQELGAALMESHGLPATITIENTSK